MIFEGLRIGFAITGSFCTIKDVVPEIIKLVELGADVTPIISFNVNSIDTRFYQAGELKKELCNITGKQLINKIEDAEPIGPKSLLDILVVAPCSGNTLAKMANGVNDTPVTMAIKSHLRNNRPVIISISTNDGLSASAKNIGALLNRRNVYFVPFGQDNPKDKQTSLISDNKLIQGAIECAVQGKQLQPLLV